MKIDVHCHQIEKFFHETLAALPGVTVKVNPDRFSYLLKDGKTWLPFRPEMFDPDHLIREMDRKGIDISILSMNTPSVYIFGKKLRIDLPGVVSASVLSELAICAVYPGARISRGVQASAAGDFRKAKRPVPAVELPMMLAMVCWLRIAASGPDLSDLDFSAATAAAGRLPAHL